MDMAPIILIATPILLHLSLIHIYATAAANDPKVTLVYAEVNPLDTIVGQTATPVSYTHLIQHAPHLVGVGIKVRKLQNAQRRLVLCSLAALTSPVCPSASWQSTSRR